MGVKLREERRLRVFENRVLREIFGTKTDEVTGECRKLLVHKLSDLFCSPHITFSGDQMKKSKIGGACSTYGEDERCKEGFGGGNLIAINNLEDLGFDGRKILKLILKKWNGDMDWFALAQDKDRWRAVVNAVMNLRFLENVGNFLTS